MVKRVGLEDLLARPRITLGLWVTGVRPGWWIQALRVGGFWPSGFGGFLPSGSGLPGFVYFCPFHFPSRIAIQESRSYPVRIPERRENVNKPDFLISFLGWFGGFGSSGLVDSGLPALGFRALFTFVSFVHSIFRSESRFMTASGCPGPALREKCKQTRFSFLHFCDYFPGARNFKNSPSSEIRAAKRHDFCNISYNNQGVKISQKLGASILIIINYLIIQLIKLKIFPTKNTAKVVRKIWQLWVRFKFRFAPIYLST